MAIKRIIDPAAEPLTLEEVKLHLRVDDDDEDNNISLYIRAAREFTESFLGRALVTQTWMLTLDEFPDEEIKIPLPPLQSITQIAYDDTSGIERIIDPADYFVDNQSEPGWVVPAGTLTWPTTIDAINSVRVKFVAGYAPSTDSPPDLTTNIPYNIKAAMLLIIGNLFENREDNVVGTIANRIPNGAEYLLRRHKFDLSMA